MATTRSYRTLRRVHLELARLDVLEVDLDRERARIAARRRAAIYHLNDLVSAGETRERRRDLREAA
ncbi:MAG: hypothetical protein AB1416_08360 [Actinomycetota bacterium]